MCKEEYNIAIYKCPCCGIPHSRLRPGAYGIFRRKCICGALLPLTARGKGYIDPATASSGIGSVSGKYKLTDMKSFCPHCGADRNEVDCDCDKKQIDPRFAALRALLDSDMGE